MHRCGNYLRTGSTQQLPGTCVVACQDPSTPHYFYVSTSAEPSFFFTLLHS